MTNAHITIPSHAQFSKTLPVVIFIHGFFPGNLFPMDETMVETIKATNKSNVYFMNYIAYAKNLNYAQVVVDVKKIGQILGKSLSQMKDCE